VIDTAIRLMVGLAGVRIPVAVRYFLQNIQTYSGYHLLRTEWVQESVSGGKAARRVKLKTHVFLFHTLGMIGAI
jgi:hypothetical protein